ncbi:MAG TPA: DUF3341 domain-containing protein [Kiritimatiellia bacterium]|nr:DUF3341 domain-containing protein [Kiritimatiellia bacterium]
MSEPVSKPKLYALVAEYPTPEALLKAAEQVRDAGYKRVDALSPFPVHGIVEALGIPKSRMAGLVLGGAIAGALGGFALQTWLSVYQYPHVVSGRPLFSWPNFIPVIFECSILVAGLTAFVGMLVRNNLPRPYHPVFAAPRVENTTTSTFMIVIEAVDPKFDAKGTAEFLKKTGADFVGEAPFEESGADQHDGPLMN